MTKKVRHWRGRSKTTNSVIKTVNKDTFAGAICPTNVEEQKKKFLEYGKTPEFTHRGTDEELEEIYSSPRSEIRFDLLGEAMHILKMVKEKYGDAENYYNEMYGDRITKTEATDIIVDYLKENHLDGAMTVIWCTDLPCSGRMMWQGPHAKHRRPEARRYSMWIKDAKDNNFLREQGIRCLADHEIGTHFFRSFNDGLQPWFADRSKFGIRGLSGLDQLRTEEGLAAVNTILNARVRYLWGPALLYCKRKDASKKRANEDSSSKAEEKKKKKMDQEVKLNAKNRQLEEIIRDRRKTEEKKAAEEVEEKEEEIQTTLLPLPSNTDIQEDACTYTEEHAPRYPNWQGNPFNSPYNSAYSAFQNYSYYGDLMSPSTSTATFQPLSSQTELQDRCARLELENDRLKEENKQLKESIRRNNQDKTEDIACKATEMTFKQLFEHLSMYVANPEVRWRHCVRVKRGLLNPNDIGGYGKDQCYFEGAVQILRNIDSIDFKVLMSGKVCYDEISRVKKLARTDCIQMPDFMRNQEKYKKSLKQIAHMNGLHLTHPKYKAPAAYARRLKKGRRTGARKGSNKVRKNGQKGSHSGGYGKTLFVSTDGEGESEGESMHSVGWENEEKKFVFEQMNFSDLKNATCDEFFEAFARGKLAGISAEQLKELNERNSMNYFRKLVNRMEIMGSDVDADDNEDDKQLKGVVTLTCEKSETKERTFMKEYDTTAPEFRSVSRASIRPILNQKSNSLNSRGNKNMNAESVSQQRLLSAEDDEPSSPTRSSATLSATRSEASNSAGVYSSHHRYSLKSTPLHPCTVPSSQLNSPGASLADATTIDTEALSQVHHSTSVSSNSTLSRPQHKSAHLPKSLSSQNIVKAGIEGFIYPDVDMLTDDMLKVKMVPELYDFEQPCQDLSSDGKLLRRRVKSAANMLPKLF